jgi:predicted 3-demethylubiquinone-9 3-methyltransferase (glyoxalase superfamily)
MITQKITPFLWYQKDALAIGRYYQSVFGSQNVEIVGEDQFSDTPSGTVEVMTLKIFGTEFRIMTAGEYEPFNGAISFEVTCADQNEIDTYWNVLTKEGREMQCGWCADKYGVRWQIVPENMGQYISTKAGMEAMLTMKKLVIKDLKKAAGV